MIAAYFLIVLFTAGKDSAMTSVPMESAEACQQAAVQAKSELEGTFSIVRTSCVRGKP
ncbi:MULTISPECIES: hypothetical protein [Pseudomonas]|uniref:hypothetical protein n=1 Tax=Pseudomonas TaxID=286 RepID=UPI001304B523|nr:hypothetical protein [Pseudomonas sp. BRM28]